MRIYIFGPTAVGKTTLAKRLSAEYSIPHIELDQIMFRVVNKKRIRQKDSKIKNELKKYIKKQDWIIEGVYLFDEFIEKSDKIIYLKAPLLILLSRQWKRYFLDKSERKIFGFKNNFTLSIRTIARFISRKKKLKKDLFAWNMGTYRQYLQKYQHKIEEIQNVKWTDIEKYA